MIAARELEKFETILIQLFAEHKTDSSHFQEFKDLSCDNNGMVSIEAIRLLFQAFVAMDKNYIKKKGVSEKTCGELYSNVVELLALLPIGEYTQKDLNEIIYYAELAYDHKAAANEPQLKRLDHYYALIKRFQQGTERGDMYVRTLIQLHKSLSNKEEIVEHDFKMLAKAFPLFKKLVLWTHQDYANKTFIADKIIEIHAKKAKSKEQDILVGNILQPADQVAAVTASPSETDKPNQEAVQPQGQSRFFI